MRILLDECLPRKLKTSFSEHQCRTVPEAGFAEKEKWRATFAGGEMWL